MRPSRTLVALFAALAGFGLALHQVTGGVFKADDFEILRRAGSWRDVWRDLCGPQYGLSFFVFWRPAITLSLFIDRALFGLRPDGFLRMNALAFVASALILFDLARALVPDRRGVMAGFALALLWLVHPAVLVSTRWVAGRVDTHTTLWILLALRLHLAHRRGAPRWPALAAAAIAIAHKESALGLPLLFVGLDLLDPRPVHHGRPFPGLAAFWLWPAALVLRFVLLGTVAGGYGFMRQAGLAPGALLAGAWGLLAHALLPRLSEGAEATGVPGILRSIWLSLVLLAAYLANRRAARRGGPGARRLLGFVLLAAGVLGPLAPLLASMGAPGNQRYGYLAVLLVFTLHAYACATLARSVPAALLTLLPLAPILWARPLEAARMAAHDRFVASALAAMDRAETRLARRAGPAPGPAWRRPPLVLGGDAQAACHPQRFLWGLGAVRRPPFVAERQARDVVSLRPLHPLARGKIPQRWFAAYPGLLVVAGGGVRPAGGSGPLPREAAALDFDGVLRLAHLEPDVRAGFSAGAGFEGPVLAATPLGSLVLDTEPKNGRLRLADLLRAPLVPDGGLYAGLLLWNAFDLEPESGVHLYWREGGRLVHAVFRPAPGLARALLPALGG